MSVPSVTPPCAYALITPAHNEAAMIGRTIESVLRQDPLPARWVIVDDASTDDTAQIVARYAARSPVIRLMNLARGGAASFAAKARAVQAGREELAGVDCGFIGVLDADVTFEPDYFARILERFQQQPKLGVASGLVVDVDSTSAMWAHSDLETVFGAIQLFRRECFEQIGGYLPLRGGVDTVAVLMARMKGWETRTFPDIRVIHHRPGGTGSPWRLRFHQGRIEYEYGMHPLYALVRSVYRMREPPWGISSCLRLAGYASGWMSRRPRPVPPEFVDYVRREQTRRLFGSGRRARAGS